MFGYSRPLGPHDTLEGMAVLDVMRPLVTMSATRQIGKHTAATATVRWEVAGEDWVVVVMGVGEAVALTGAEGSAVVVAGLQGGEDAHGGDSSGMLGLRGGGGGRIKRETAFN